MFPVQFGGSSLSSQVWSITIHAINSIINHLYFAISEFCKMWSWLGFPRSKLRDTVPTLILAQPFEHGWQTALDSSTLPFTPVAARMLYLSWNPGTEQLPDGFPTADSTLISLPPGPPGPGQHCSTLSRHSAESWTTSTEGENPMVSPWFPHGFPTSQWITAELISAVKESPARVRWKGPEGELRAPALPRGTELPREQISDFLELGIVLL